ncbi:MAG: right-handed parallel beta-helix repeat-containing protein [Promethearchaeota archaeon]|jgi:parallel beta-helix repeat protein
MKSKLRVKAIIPIVLGLVFALSTMFYANINFYSDNSSFIDNENLKNSEVSGRISIYINTGWINLKNAGKCTGEGTLIDPYVIRDLEIDGGGFGSCIFIEGSTVYFKVENCTLYNSGGDSEDGGIKLLNVVNGQLINNILSNNGRNGILMKFSDNNTITGNIITSNYIGIYLYHSENNDVSNNDFSGNSYNIQTYPGSSGVFPFTLGFTETIIIAVVVIVIIFASLLIIYKKRAQKRSKFPIKKERPISRPIILTKVPEIQPKPPPIKEIEDESIHNCPHCGQKLYKVAKFCINCGKKIVEDKIIPIQSQGETEKLKGEQAFAPISELIKEASSQTPVTDIDPPQVEEVTTIQIEPEEKGEKILSQIPKMKAEEIQPTPPIRETIEEKPKILPLFCIFCGDELNRDATYCPVCGSKVKKSNFFSENKWLKFNID